MFYFTGLLIGAFSFLVIGLFHPIVIKTEYYTGTRYWWIFLVVGIIGCIAAMLVWNLAISSMLSVFSFSCFWSIKELFEQRERVKKGWFPKNPNRKYDNELEENPSSHE
ncbi:MAG TPA: DUF4491 domain-containing protein [Prevotellaceae bacterium]|nr:DUF4491 domain-containing protein [Prevotellaceae bacterium]